MISLPLFISGAEIAFIIFIVIMVFGADKVPEIARGLGKGMRQLKDATNDIKSEITKTAERNDIDLDLTKDIKKEIDKAKEDINDITGPIKRSL
ncbi:sec-independent protein translocase protein TatA [Dokdonia sp. Hel_I_63]|jgi:sec-independent protein translocase protein TatA|uniref:Sec-independent protein translocase subunit TatA/TatB n=1 Tax=unclassified Dokdonia TaxID=2615033 RepID=UPI00020A7ABA|nr:MULTISPECIES: twin-arginine translocase TatA/TatE family subunit [unclassified Dokdonia]AEE19894.1 twin-arginine translocation protein, TatA/E family subunit [Dokdonia sp. 4H-3-7-5]AWH73026.1 twin-arginine translocase TatA/TatE family subunit [Dokdonia sp. Dokd-P16]TVZ23888.1 sec-independent protein translocase protein TatA [Dokdonia sp. Hel_I_63]|tara:strand:- start:44027 stop:44308 length:282 start_codon:yes stop_codon:yes gene_type:complete